MQDVFSKLGTDYQPIIKNLVAEKLTSIDELEMEVCNYMSELENIESQTEFLDVATALGIAYDCLELIELVSKHYSERRHLALQVAIRYFVLEDDVESDASSIIGFDDDAEVVEIAKEFITRTMATNE